MPKYATGKARTGLIRIASYASVTTAIMLVVLKAWAWRQTDSVSLLSSLIDSGLDVLASLITFFAVHVSLKPPDREHRFGHGKAEGLAALAQSAIITTSAVYVMFETINRMLNPETITNATLGITVMLISIVLTLALVNVQGYVQRRTDSTAITADATHYKTDLVMNLGVMTAIALSALPGGWLADPIVAAMIVLYLLHCIGKIAKRALDILMDREIPDNDRERIIQLAENHSEVRSIRNLKTRHSGSNYIVQFHVLLDASLGLIQAHQIMAEVEERIRTEFPDCELLLRPDPDDYQP